MQFKQWFVIEEGLWGATVAGLRAFKAELGRPTTMAFEAQIGSISSATDVLFAVDQFYKKIAPAVDAGTAKKLEAKLESAVRKVGYNVHPKDISRMSAVAK